MTDENVLNQPTPQPTEGAEPAPPPGPIAPPIESRFLFVDVAAMRAKQLRRGALPRLAEVASEAVSARPDLPHKAERIAMEEVRQGLIGCALADGNATPEGVS